MEEEKHSAVHSDGEGDLRRRLSRAMLHFQDRLLEGNISPGSLCQVRPAESAADSVISRTCAAALSAKVFARICAA